MDIDGQTQMVSLQGVSTQQSVVLATVVGLAVVGGVAVFALEGPASGAAVEQVPGEANMLVRVDMAVANDTASQRLVRSGLNSSLEELTSRDSDSVLSAAVGNRTVDRDNVSAVGGEVDERTDLDPRAVSEVVVFGKLSRSMSYTDAEYGGVIVHADWDRAAVLETARNGTTTYERTSYNGQTVLKPVSGNASEVQWVGVLDSGQYVLGSEAAVKDTIDVAAGDAAGFGGKLRTAYEDTRPGLVRFAFAVPDESVPSGETGSVDTESFQDVDTVAGSYYTTATGAGVEVRLVAAGPQSARDVEDVTNGLRAIASGTVENETTEAALRQVSIERSGSTVTVSYEQSVDTVEAVVRYLYRDYVV